MGEAHLLGVGDQDVGEFAVAHEAAVGAAPPGAQVDLVHAHGRVEAVALPPGGHPLPVAPFPRPGVVDHRGGARGVLAGEGEGIGLEGEDLAGRAHDLELVEVARDHAGDEELPHARRPEGPHDVPAPVPVVELAHHAHAPGIGRPHGEVHAGHAVAYHGVGAQLLVQAQVRALAHEVDVQLAQARAEAVGVLHVLGILAPPMDAVVVAEPLLQPGQHHLEESLGVDHGQFRSHVAGLLPDQLHPGRPRREDPRLEARAGQGMEPEERGRVAAVPPQEGLHVKSGFSHWVSYRGVRSV